MKIQTMLGILRKKLPHIAFYLPFSSQQHEQAGRAMVKQLSLQLHY